MLIAMNIQWDKYLRAGHRNSFFFDIELGDGFIMRWHPKVYRRVLRAAKLCAERMQKDKI